LDRSANFSYNVLATKYRLHRVERDVMAKVKEDRLDWENRIVIDPEILLGKPIIKGTRLAVDFVIDLLAQGWSESEILRNYPGLSREDIKACLGYASASLRAEKVYPMLVA